MDYFIGRCKKIIPNIEKECKDRDIDFEIRYISKERSGYDIALEYKEKEDTIGKSIEKAIDKLSVLMYNNICVVIGTHNFILVET